MPIKYDGPDGLVCGCKFEKDVMEQGRADGLLDAVYEGGNIIALRCPDCGRVFDIVERKR